MDDKSLRSYMAEMVGTFAVVLISAGAICVQAMGWSQVNIPLAAGLIYAAVLAVTIPLSGGYLNPAVTIALWVFKRLDGVKTVGLVFAQVLGAVIAGLLLRFLLPLREDALIASHLGTPHLDPAWFQSGGVTALVLLKGIGTELAMTFILVFVIFGTSLDPRAPRWLGPWAHRLSALWIGLTLAAVSYFGFPITGAAVNPARWLGPAIASKTIEPLANQAFADHSVWWLGPILGALLASWFYTALILPAEEQAAAPLTAPSRVGASAAVTSTLFRARK